MIEPWSVWTVSPRTRPEDRIPRGLERDAQIVLVQHGPITSRGVNQLLVRLGSGKILGHSQFGLCVGSRLEEPDDQVGLDVEMGQDLPISPAVDPARPSEIDRGHGFGDQPPLADQRRPYVTLVSRHPPIQDRRIDDWAWTVSWMSMILIDQ